MPPPGLANGLQRQPFGHIKVMRFAQSAAQVVKKEKPPQGKGGFRAGEAWGVGDGGCLAGAFSTGDRAVSSGSAGLVTLST